MTIFAIIQFYRYRTENLNVLARKMINDKRVSMRNSNWLESEPIRLQFSFSNNRLQQSSIKLTFKHRSWSQSISA